MTQKVSVIVTGEHESIDSNPLQLKDGRTVEWTELSLLKFERVPVEKEFMEGLEKDLFQWIVFTSPRAVQFWTETLLEHGLDMPVETQISAIGEATADYANENGYTPDFYPTEPGSENFILEFKDLLSNNSDRPRVLIPQAANGRTYLKEKLEELGCKVTVLPLYKTLPVEDAPEVSEKDIEKADLVLFTSPSSFNAFKKHYRLPKQGRLGAIGKYTYDFLLQNGVPADLLPGGDFNRIGEILC